MESIPKVLKFQLIKQSFKSFKILVWKETKWLKAFKTTKEIKSLHSTTWLPRNLSGKDIQYQAFLAARTLMLVF